MLSAFNTDLWQCHQIRSKSPLQKEWMPGLLQDAPHQLTMNDRAAVGVLPAWPGTHGTDHLLPSDETLQS